MKTISLLVLLWQFTGFTADLGEMTVTVVPEAEMGNYVVRNPNEAILIVHATIVPLSFESNMGIIKVENPRQGEYMLHLRPGTNIIHFKNEAYQSASKRLYIDKKRFKEVMVGTLLNLKTLPISESARNEVKYLRVGLRFFTAFRMI